MIIKQKEKRTIIIIPGKRQGEYWSLLQSKAEDYYYITVSKSNKQIYKIIKTTSSRDVPFLFLC